MSETGSIEWSESGSAAEIQGMIEEWKAEGKRGITLLIAVQEMISEAFLNTLSPRSCNNLRRFLIQYDVPVDMRVDYPNYRATLDLVRRNPTLSGAPSALDMVTTGDIATSIVAPTKRHDSHMFTAAGHVADNSRPSELVHNPAVSDASARDDISNWASVPALRSDLDSTAENETVQILNATVHTTSRGPALNRAVGPSRSIVDLIKTYSTDKGNFSGENLNSH
jgi:hypothetical protein